MSALTAKITKIIQPGIEALGLEFWGCEYHPQGKYSLLRVYVEREGGVTIDDCQRVSDYVGTLLDVEEQLLRQYTLEVSSPGIYRSLFTLEQFQRYIGHAISIQLRSPIEGQRNFKGILESVEGEQLTLEYEGRKIQLIATEIEKANLA